MKVGEMLNHVFTTAIEGGINYWASTRNYRWSLRDTANEPTWEPDPDNFFADIIDEEDGETAYHINRRIMERGWRYAYEHRDKFNWSTEPIPELVEGDALDNWDFDAWDADMILQMGLWEQVKYG